MVYESLPQLTLVESIELGTSTNNQKLQVSTELLVAMAPCCLLWPQPQQEVAAAAAACCWPHEQRCWPQRCGAC
jgi:hypothetical protein